MIFNEDDVPLPKVISAPEGYHYSTHVIAWNGRTFLTWEEAMEFRKMYIEVRKKREEQLKQVLSEEFDNPCATCVCMDANGDCEVYRGKTCSYDITDEAIEEVTRRIISEIIQK